MNWPSLIKKKPPAVMFGLRLVVVPNDKCPKDHIILAVHPDQHARFEERVNKAFAEWTKKQPKQK